MTFKDDRGGFVFGCEDAKMAFGSGTWSTHLSQIARVTGPIYVMTGLLPDTDYISGILAKRPREVFIIANSQAQLSAQAIKHRFPAIRIALHPTNNAKVVLVAPDKVWVSSSDFGKSDKIEAAIGMHSETLFTKTHETLFKKIWQQSHEIP